MQEYISSSKVLSKVREEDLFYYYFSIDVSKKRCKSIIRLNDHNASMKFRKKNGRIKWSDFGTNYMDCDIFDLLYLTHKLSFYEALVRINIDFNLGLKYSTKYNIDILIPNPINTDTFIPDLEEDSEIDLQVCLNKYNNIPIFTKEDLKYWNQGFLQQPKLQKHKIFSVNTVFLNGDAVMKYHKKDPIFLYVEKVDEESYYKIYRPLHDSSKGKWLSNIKQASKAIGGLKWLTDDPYVIITKSKKDYLVLKEVLGFNAVYIQSESTPIDVDIMDMLWNKYNVIYSLFDNDEAGIRLNDEFASVNDTIPIMYDSCMGKDTWDLILKYKNVEQCKEIIWNLMK